MMGKSLVRLAVFLTLLVSCFAGGNESGSRMTSVLVYYEPGRFGGWPANSGVWIWENEIVVGFMSGHYKSQESEHSLDKTRPSVTALARSRDGGETWVVEEHPELADKRIVSRDDAIDFGHPDFAMRCNDDRFHISYDRAKTWHGPFQFPDFGLQKELSARTDYLVTGKRSCLVFLSAEDDHVQAGLKDRAFCAETTDGGKTFQFLGWMTGDPRSVRSVMPSTVKVGEQQLVSVLRRRINPPGGGPRNDLNWIDAYSSEDSGRTWTFLKRIAYTDLGLRNGNPPSLVRLKDGRLAVTYGFRGVPYGIRAKISNDNGKNWGPEIVLRDDGRTWDLGYPRSVCRPDGKVVTIYYYSTASRPEQHIEATIWDPNAMTEHH